MGYSTKQRKILIETLERHRDETLSADQIADLIGEDKISRSAVYRNLSVLEEQGCVNRFTLPGTKRIFFRYTGSEKCRDHLHLECFKCGRTYHMNVPSTNALIENVMRQSKFEVDSGSTVLYGVCEKCRKS
ncbi:MAG: transcriptional repressor [Clostridiales bacterium]|nr:transcriptional repressor [Clostridiales bacterium]